MGHLLARQIRGEARRAGLRAYSSIWRSGYRRALARIWRYRLDGEFEALDTAVQPLGRSHG